MLPLSFFQLFMIVIAFGAHFEVSESSPAPTCITSGYLAKKEEATTAQLEEIAALPVLSPDGESDSSSGAAEAVYEKVLTATETSPSAKIEASFYEAIAAVASAYYKACFRKRPSSSLEFTSLLAKYDSARERSDIRTLREAFGSLTCLKKRHLSSKKKRGVKRDITCTNPADVEEFFDCLDATDLGRIFFTTGVPFSVAFVIDDTASMGDEIEAVKCLVRSFIKSERDGPSEYILGTFNDPENDTALFTPKSYNTDSLSDMERFIGDLNSIEAHGGDDLPEYGIRGIKRAFDESIKTTDSDGGVFSQLLLFTDDTAKDYSDINDVFLLISSTDVVVSAFLPQSFVDRRPECGSYTSPSYQTCIDGSVRGYTDLVDNSGGILVGSLARDTSLSEFIKQYNFDTGAQLSSIDCSNRKKRSGNKIPMTPMRERRFAAPTESFIVSDLADQFKLTITTTYTSHIQIINPVGTEVISQSITTIGFFHFGDDDMMPGTWIVTSTSDFSMDVSVENRFIFTAELLDDSNEPLDSLPPFGCTASQPLLIFTPHLKKLSRSSSDTFNATMLTADGEVLGRTQLEHCGAYFRGRVTIPGKPFYVQFNGISKGGYVFSATVYNRFNPTPWTLQSVLTSANTEVPAGESSDLAFRLTTNTASEWSSCALTVNIEASTTLSGITLAVIPRQITLRQSAPADFTVRATAASGTAPARGRLELSFSGDHDGKQLHTTKSTFIGVGRPGCPCLNGGKCSTFRRGRRIFNRCLCPTGYSGTLCERT